MSAGTLNLTIEQGANLSQAVTVDTAFNGRTPTGAIYDRFGGRLLVALTATAVSGGSTTLSLTAAQTAALRAPAYIRDNERSCVIGYYELIDTNAGVVTRIKQGTVTLSRTASIP